MAVPGNSRVDRYGNIHTKLGTDSPDFGFKTDWDAVRDQEAEFKAYLGTTDYAAQNKEATDFAKLQFALSLMGRGFAAMGATPKRGESALGTLGRAMVAPIAGDFSTISGTLMKQRAATKLAERQEERQRKMAAWTAARGSAKDMRALALELLEDEPTAVTAGLTAGDYHLYTPDGEVFKIGDRTPVVRAISKGKDIGKWLDLGTVPPTIIPAANLTARKITADSAGAAAKGMKDPKFKDTFRGMMAQMSHIQTTQELGKTGLRFNAKKFNLNPDLKPGENFALERVVGVDDGEIVTEPLTKAEQGVYADNLRASYLNVFDAIRTGKEPANLNRAFIATELSKSLTDLGLDPVSTLPPGVIRGRAQITNPREITRAYAAAAPNFGPNLEATINNLPDPRDNKNLSSGTGRIVLYNKYGVPFNNRTVSPGPLPAAAGAQAVVDRSNKVRGLDRNDVQIRVLAEKIANGTSLGAKLRTSTADSTGKQLTVVGDALEAERKQLTDALGNPKNANTVEAIEKSLEMLTRLQKLDADLKLSGVGGFLIGPAEGGLQKYLGLDVGKYFRTKEGKRAAARFIQQLPITHQLFARDILRVAGEQRFTNKDLEGAQSTLVKLNQSDGFNAGTLRELTGYMKNIVRSGLNSIGTFELPDSTLQKAAKLGIPLKSIKTKNNYYNPYFSDQKYAVTKQPVPSYSKAYLDKLRDDGIFGYAALRGTKALSYRLIEVDAKGKPIPKIVNGKKAGVVTRVVAGKPEWQTTISPAMLDYNRNWLLKTYSLDR